MCNKHRVELLTSFPISQVCGSKTGSAIYVRKDDSTDIPTLLSAPPSLLCHCSIRNLGAEMVGSQEECSDFRSRCHIPSQGRTEILSYPVLSNMINMAFLRISAGYTSDKVRHRRSGPYKTPDQVSSSTNTPFRDHRSKSSAPLGAANCPPPIDADPGFWVPVPAAQNACEAFSLCRS